MGNVNEFGKICVIFAIDGCSEKMYGIRSIMYHQHIFTHAPTRYDIDNLSVSVVVTGEYFLCDTQQRENRKKNKKILKRQSR